VGFIPWDTTRHQVLDLPTIATKEIEGMKVLLKPTSLNTGPRLSTKRGWSEMTDLLRLASRWKRELQAEEEGAVLFS